MPRHNSNYYASPDQLTFFGEIKSVVATAVQDSLTDLKRTRDPRRKLSNYPENMTPDQVADYLQVSRVHVINLYDDAQLPGQNIASAAATKRCLRFKRAEVAAYEQRAQQRDHMKAPQL